MNFKDQMNKDLAVFVHVDEFGEVHNVDGHDIPIVIDEDNLNERPRQPLDLYNAVNGVYIATMTIHVRLADMAERPVVGQHLRLDGERRPVLSCSEDMGMLKIVLEVKET